MATISDILGENRRPAPIIGPDATVLKAARLMNEYKVGALVVCTDGICKGIFTERDLLRCFASSFENLPQTPVSEVMSVELFVCTPTTSIEEARRVMVLAKVRNLPVIDPAGKVVGLITLEDLNTHESGDQATEIHFLKQYLYAGRD